MPDFFGADFVNAIDRRELHNLPLAIVDPAAERDYLPRIPMVEKTQIGCDVFPVLEKLGIAFDDRGDIPRLVYHHHPADRGHNHEHADDKPAVDRERTAESRRRIRR